jgi:DNA invertase Pin-like site-specific DNA recombinase
MRVGYARVSRKDQSLEPQRDTLLADGCETVFEEKVSSREVDRKALQGAFDYCREGDVLVMVRLDRLGRSLRELIDLVGELWRVRAWASGASRRASTQRQPAAG